MSQPLKIFISYARRDEAFKDDFLVHLTPLIRDESIKVWHDNDTLPGEEFDERIKENLADADIVLFLVSPNFMASEYIRKEIRQTITRYEQGTVKIIPIWIKDIAVPDRFLERFQSLPKDRKPVSKWADQDEAWVDVVKRLNQLIKKMNEPAIDTNKNDDLIKSDNLDISNTNIAFSKTNIRDLISRGRTKDALQSLLTHTANGDTDVHNSLTILSSRYNELERNSRLGIVSNEESRLERNRINMALLSLLEEI